MPRTGKTQFRLTSRLTGQALVLPDQILRIRKSGALECLPARAGIGGKLSDQLLKVDGADHRRSTFIRLKCPPPKWGRGKFHAPFIELRVEAAQRGNIERP